VIILVVGAAVDEALALLFGLIYERGESIEQWLIGYRRDVYKGKGMSGRGGD
jgi:hypothetical protein